jgi:hypothetical protein
MRYRVLTAFFAARAEADGALHALCERGVPPDAVRVLPKDVVHLDDVGVKVATRAPAGAAIGAIAGGLVGLVTGALGAGGAVLIPSIGAVLAGPIVAALAGAAVAGMIGAITGAFFGARVPVFEAAYLDDAVHEGGALVAVRCFEERSDDIEAILAIAGARRVRRGPTRLVVSP